MSSRSGLRDADAAFGGLEAIGLGVVLGAVVSVGGFAIEVFAGAIVESGVGVDPHLDVGVSLKVDGGLRDFGDADGDQKSIPDGEGWSLRPGCRP